MMVVVITIILLFGSLSVCTKDNVNDKTDLLLSLFKILWCMRMRTGHCNINKVGRKALRTENLVNLTTFMIISD